MLYIIALKDRDYHIWREGRVALFKDGKVCIVLWYLTRFAFIIVCLLVCRPTSHNFKSVRLSTVMHDGIFVELYTGLARESENRS